MENLSLHTLNGSELKQLSMKHFFIFIKNISHSSECHGRTPGATCYFQSTQKYTDNVYFSADGRSALCSEGNYEVL